MQIVVPERNLGSIFYAQVGWKISVLWALVANPFLPQEPRTRVDLEAY